MNKNARTDDVDFLADWCIAVDQFMFHASPEILESAVECMERARKNQNLRGLRMAYRDSIEFAGDLGPGSKVELNKILVKKFGFGLEPGVREIAREARAMLKRGKIETADECRLLETRLIKLCQKKSRPAEIDAINKLLASLKKPMHD